MDSLYQTRFCMVPFGVSNHIVTVKISTTISLCNMIPLGTRVLLRNTTINQSEGAGADSVDNWLQSIEKYANGELKIRSFHGFSMRVPVAFP